MTYRFGPFVFTAPGTLTRSALPVRLQPQPALVLALLLERAGTLVTRDELKAAVWPDGTHVDFERGLNFAVAQVRSALGDSADSPRYVETVPKRGYRFVAPVAAVASMVDTPAAQVSSTGSEPAETGNARPARWTMRAGIAAALVLLAVVAAIALAAFPGDERVRIAVLPFDNETADSRYEGVAGGIADETVARLSTPDRIARFDVIGNAAALRRPRAFRDVRAIGRDIGAAYVVLAQLKRDDEGVRLIAHLIRVSDEAHVWAQTFDRTDFTLATQTELAESIAAAVTEKMGTDPVS